MKTKFINFKKEICNVSGCNLKARPIIRGFYVCKKCFEIFKEDNKIRIENKMKIPNKLIITQELKDRMNMKNSKELFKSKKLNKYKVEKKGIYGIFQ